MKQYVGKYNIAFLVLDSLRYDVAETEFLAKNTPNLKGVFPQGWEKRHSPGSFTYAAHSAFFAGFLPTPSDSAASPERLFAAEFIGSETIGEGTYCFPESNVVTALQREGYHTTCIGGVGFFNKQNALSNVFPSFFCESYWSPEMGVIGKDSTEKQFALAQQRVESLAESENFFLYINISAIHQPNCHYLNLPKDTLESHAAALHYVDKCLPPLIQTLRDRETFLIMCSDHGTLYGEKGFTGHRVGHEAVYTVPYAEQLLKKTS